MRLENFLFCEMARNEANGQVSLIGLFPGDIMILGLPEGIPLQLVPNLHCVVILSGMQTVRGIRYQCQVRSKGLEIVAGADEHIPRPPPLTPFQSLMFGFSPFPCTQGEGDYEFRITVQPDGVATPTTYSKTFTFQRKTIPLPTSH